MSHDQDTYVTIGKFGSTYGVHGWLKVHSFTEFGESILEYSPWFISRDGDNWQPITIEDGRMHSQTVIVKLPDLNTPEDAKLYTGYDIAIPRSQLPQLNDDEFYWSDLEGLSVIDQHGKNIGTVSYLIETGSNDVLVVKGEQDQAIPFLRGSVVKRVDLATRTIYVDWDPL